MSIKRLALFLLAAIGLSAASVNLTGISCTSGTATVTCTACAIAQYQGFSIQGSSVSTYNINATAKTASANQFTFPVTCNGSATGGTVQPAKQIINIGPSTPIPASGNITLSYVFWFTTTLPIPLACNLPPTGTTCPTSIWSGASTAENAAIVAGTTIEVPGSLTVGATVAAATIESNLVTQYNAIETGYSAGLLAGLGFWWNGTGWVNQ